MLQILSRTHETFVGFGTPLVPFEDQVRKIFCLYTPDSFQSRLLIDIFTVLDNKLSDYYLITKPNRLIFKDKLNLNFISLYDDPKSLFIGELFNKVLKPLCQFISIESFRELFWYFSDGEIKLLHEQLILLMDDPFQQFCNSYQKLAQHIMLIQLHRKRYSKSSF
jgi:hypothetical protein